ncbi:MAG: hypothetical protein ACTSVF_01545 [Candidatus Asgardarchaeia archaeon]
MQDFLYFFLFWILLSLAVVLFQWFRTWIKLKIEERRTRELEKVVEKRE